MNRPHRLALALLLIGTTACASGCRSRAKELEQLAEHWKVVFNSHDLPGTTALYATNGAYMTPGMIYFVRTPAELRSALDALWRTYPDMHITNIHSVVAGDDKVAFAWELAFTMPATKAPQLLRGASFMTLEDGRVAQQLIITSR